MPRPPHWTGFTLRSRAGSNSGIDRDNRLHDRREFIRAAPDAPWADLRCVYPVRNAFMPQSIPYWHVDAFSARPFWRQFRRR